MLLAGQVLATGGPGIACDGWLSERRGGAEVEQPLTTSKKGKKKRGKKRMGYRAYGSSLGVRAEDSHTQGRINRNSRVWSSFNALSLERSSCKWSLVSLCSLGSTLLPRALILIIVLLVTSGRMPHLRCSAVLLLLLPPPWSSSSLPPSSDLCLKERVRQIKMRWERPSNLWERLWEQLTFTVVTWK